jgi:hypothetical protein
VEQKASGRLAAPAKSSHPTDEPETKIADIRKELRRKINLALNKLKGLLTDDQKKARQEARQAGKKRREALEALELAREIAKRGTYARRPRPDHPQEVRDPCRPERTRYTERSDHPLLS